VAAKLSAPVPIELEQARLPEPSGELGDEPRLLRIGGAVEDEDRPLARGGRAGAADEVVLRPGDEQKPQRKRS
jgi:hypothetical protein